MIDEPEREWDKPVVTTLATGNHSLRTTRWHYIRYADGAEELYDHDADPHEWDNVTSKRNRAAVVEFFRSHTPRKNRELVVGQWQDWEIKAWRRSEENARRRRAN